jgi:hypothetical protein
MIDWIAAEHGLSRQDVVDAGNWNVGMTMPLSVFADHT